MQTIIDDRSSSGDCGKAIFQCVQTGTHKVLIAFGAIIFKYIRSSKWKTAPNFLREMSCLVRTL